MPRRRASAMAPLAAKAANMPPWPSGLHGQPARRFQQQLARRPRRRPAWSPGRRPQVLGGQAEAVVPGEELDGLVVRGRAGHQVQRRRVRRAAGPWPGSSRRGSGTASGRRTGPIGNIPLGWWKPSRVPCPPATRMAPTWPASRAWRPRARASSGTGKGVGSLLCLVRSVFRVVAAKDSRPLWATAGRPAAARPARPMPKAGLIAAVLV